MKSSENKNNSYDMQNLYNILSLNFLTFKYSKKVEVTSFTFGTLTI